MPVAFLFCPDEDAMKKTTAVSVFALSIALAVGGVGTGTVFGVKPAAAAEKKVSQKLGGPLKEAQAMLQSRNYKGALSKLQEIDAMPDKSAYESFVVLQLKYNAYAGMGDWGSAAKTIDAILASGQTPPNETPVRLKQLLQAYAQQSSWAKVVETGSRYQKEVGPDPDVQILLAQAYTNQRNYKAAEDAVRNVMKSAEARGARPKEEWLGTLRFVEHEQGNAAGEQSALESLVQMYPSQKYWEDLLATEDKNLKGDVQTELDIARVRLALGYLKTADNYTDMAQLALTENLPGEAQKVMQTGMQKNVFGQVTPTSRPQRLLDMSKKQVADEQANLAARDTAAKAAATGDDEVKLGVSYWTYGQNDKAIAAIQDGIKKGVKDKDNAQLRLGMAYLAAGKKSQADAAFRAIKPGTTSASIARLWTLYAATR